MSIEHGRNFIYLDEPSDQYFQELPPLKEFDAQPYPFMLVLPSGLQHLEQIRKLMEEKGLSVADERHIEVFETFGRYIYPVVQDKPHSYAWLMLNKRLFGAKANEGHAYILDNSFSDEQTYEELTRIKREIRSHVGIRSYSVHHKGNLIDVKLHHLHAPDFNELKDQYNTLLNFTEK